MMRTWILPIALVVVALGVAVAIVHREPARPESVQIPAVQSEATIETQASAPAATTAPAAGPSVAQSQPAEQAIVSTTPPPVQRQVIKNPRAGESQPVPEPLARVALSYVGMDPDAEAVWVAAINDPRTSPKVRQNLIEDLNEDGFPDPHHVTSDDLPLIVSRLALIEELAPDAADEVNAAAFAEAYKDLANMFLRVTAQ